MEPGGGGVGDWELEESMGSGTNIGGPKEDWGGIRVGKETPEGKVT